MYCAAAMPTTDSASLAVEYQKSQDPYLLKTATYNHTGPALISLSPDARTVAIAIGSNVDIYNAETTECAQSIQDVHSCECVRS